MKCAVKDCVTPAIFHKVNWTYYAAGFPREPENRIMGEVGLAVCAAHEQYVRDDTQLWKRLEKTVELTCQVTRRAPIDPQSLELQFVRLDS
jgi:hypothetical protein